jgi:UDP-2-acetamido-3-amino-2,3-dideoxy-glucuronate N-acetyltransferase
MTHFEQTLRLNDAAPRFVDPTVILGQDCKVWHFSVLLAGVRLGDHVSIGSHCEIGRGSVIGNHSRISQGCFLPSNTTIGDHVFIGPHVVLCDDRWPRAGHQGYTAQPPRIEDNVSIGAGSIILPGVTIGRGALIGAGSIVTSDVPTNGHVRGLPARHTTLSSVSREALAMADSVAKT